MLPETINTLAFEDLAHRAEVRKLRGPAWVSHEDYHEGPGLSSTGVKALCKTAAHFIVPHEDSTALCFGRALHMAILEPELYSATYVEQPEWGDGRKTEVKAEKALFAARVEAEGLELITSDEARLIRMLGRELAKSTIWQQIRTGHRELAFYAQDAVGDVPVLRKCKPDLFHGGIVYDVKTCESALDDDVLRAIFKYGYHISARYYLDTIEKALGQRPEAFVWIFLEKKSPYGVRWIVATEEMMRIGGIECEKALSRYAECSKTNVWPSYPDRFEELETPPYISRRFEG